jgi:hypothetical protein
LSEKFVLQLPFAYRLSACSKALAVTILIVVSGAFPGAWAAGASVPYVPTPQVVVERMLEIAKVGSRDLVIDLGSGDGRIVVTAAKKFGARGFGVDLDPVRLNEANENARKAGVTDKVAFYQRDLFQTDLAQASVITMYLTPRVNLKLRPKLLELKPGTRIVSHDYSMDPWWPDYHEEHALKDGSGGTSDIYFWIVPAKVAGTWESELRVRGKSIAYYFTLVQQFQVISGLAHVEGKDLKLENAKIQGDQLRFDLTVEIDGVLAMHLFRGRVYGNGLSGTANLTGPRRNERLNWSATRTSPGAEGHGGTAIAANQNPESPAHQR